MVYNGGSLKSIEGGRIVIEKDMRRVELAASLFYKTQCENGARPRDTIENRGEPPEDLSRRAS
eukprot:1827588-Pyramimonas_sp.AAC.1